MNVQKFAFPIALVLASPILAASSFAQTAATTTKPDSHAQAKLTQQERDLRNFSKAGNSAMRDIRDARFAIFDGQPKTATTLMHSAEAELVQAQKEAPMFTSTKKSASEATGRVPFDGQLVLADNFVMTPEKQAHINKANEHLKKGENDKAVEELRLGEVDVNYTQLLIPIAQSQKHLERAISLADSGKYYEANLALKAIEDSVTAESISFADLPNRAAK